MLKDTQIDEIVAPGLKELLGPFGFEHAEACWIRQFDVRTLFGKVSE